MSLNDSQKVCTKYKKKGQPISMQIRSKLRTNKRRMNQNCPRDLKGFIIFKPLCDSTVGASPNSSKINLNQGLLCYINLNEA